MPRVHNLSIKLRSMKRLYPSFKRIQNREAARAAAVARRAAATARRSAATARHALAAAQRNIDRMARYARGENSNNNAPRAASAASASSSRAANRSLRAAERSLAAFGSLGERHNFVLGAKQKKKRFTRKMNST
jgi:hypothetical protein